MACGPVSDISCTPRGVRVCAATGSGWGTVSSCALLGKYECGLTGNGAGAKDRDMDHRTFRASAFKWKGGGERN
jgi:hypothetical protein